ncbi:16S rRNA (guanine(527)-N(7))-methyltransferase RsmG [Ferruginivarius sediminum]|uniref:Ribosomal RNA small subunit methyltransferase G n=1 Tax=Ferruginivarius sediminum TaxID=2661937 RepID=A0A369TGJ6_9PROT|nr:16S rRNA (guanine(527)-N(7))-methyltransferase RsmG [Ferruginivarius sediminum]RDD63257.1 16S rRNA (guanine(527)-N(7))-methyltransferase RsmG [Ferruginivarius sediminum]
MTYGPDDFRKDTGVSRETLERLERYVAVLTKWNRAVNLVGRRTMEDVWRRHILDSAQLFEHLPVQSAGRSRRVVDLGSGAGLPGLVLAAMGAGEVHLVESDQRKATFLREAARQMDVDVEVHASRIESLPPLDADAVTARALAPLTDLLAYAAPLLGRDGICLFLKGEGVEQELTRAGKAWKMTLDRIPSRSDRRGSILRIGGIGRDQTKSCG